MHNIYDLIYTHNLLKGAFWARPPCSFLHSWLSSSTKQQRSSAKKSTKPNPYCTSTTVTRTRHSRPGTISIKVPGQNFEPKHIKVHGKDEILLRPGLTASKYLHHYRFSNAPTTQLSTHEFLKPLHSRLDHPFNEIPELNILKCRYLPDLLRERVSPWVLVIVGLYQPISAEDVFEELAELDPFLAVWMKLRPHDLAFDSSLDAQVTGLVSVGYIQEFEYDDGVKKLEITPLGASILQN
ncbi:hypothetical protein BJ508DRAFT_303268 [Ascobolus immersus RN42]|uniref:Uncharacterized protein n=1 Tax=Ascobolus immersus RN42 TaxID=1160509 RepID=A0A3N4IJI7_ASCIM|nr:hypothetical protein BJ508DRAFT_303268 [Ascobolus immersus RN42]